MPFGSLFDQHLTGTDKQQGRSIAVKRESAQLCGKAVSELPGL